MIQLLMIADDFTGALDSGVQLAAFGAKTAVITDASSDWTRIAREADVLVVDAETRHLSPQQAYQQVCAIVRVAMGLGVPHIYKKTDSALRGNVGAELSALLHTTGAKALPFLPAFPQIGRCTRGGIHYIQDLPVDQSVFGRDPFEPVTESQVTKLVAGQTRDGVFSYPPLTADSPMPQEGGIWVFDAESQEDLLSTGTRLKEAGALSVMAGCAGFAAMLPKLLDIPAGGRTFRLPELEPRILMLCGSVNPITLEQLDLAQKAGFLRLRMAPAQKLEPDFWSEPAGRKQLARWMACLEEGGHVIIDSNDPGDNGPTAAYAQAQGYTLEDVRQRISASLGQILKTVVNVPATLMITGGDTLKQCMDCLGVYQIEPLGEVEPGVVLSRFVYRGQTRYVISKSGGFGSKDLLVSLAKRLAEGS